jgi:hypothetical protein
MIDLRAMGDDGEEGSAGNRSGSFAASIGMLLENNRVPK